MKGLSSFKDCLAVTVIQCFLCFLHWFISVFCSFMKLQQKTRRNISLHFNAQTVIQRFLCTLSTNNFLLRLILFLTFHEASAKKTGRNILWHYTAQTVIRCFHLSVTVRISRVVRVFSSAFLWILNIAFSWGYFFIGIAGFWDRIPPLSRFHPALESRPAPDFFGIPVEG